ncbi:MAG: hypothetical protein ACLT5P_10490 [Flavonifractor plautii]
MVSGVDARIPYADAREIRPWLWGRLTGHPPGGWTAAGSTSENVESGPAAIWPSLVTYILLNYQTTDMFTRP